MFNITNYPENASQSHIEIIASHLSKRLLPKRQEITNTGKVVHCRENGDDTCGCLTDTVNTEANTEAPQKVRNRPPQYPTILLPDIMPKEIIQKDVSVCVYIYMASLVAQLVKNRPAMWETPVRSLGWEDPLEKGYPLQYSGLENLQAHARAHTHTHTHTHLPQRKRNAKRQNDCLRRYK